MVNCKKCKGFMVINEVEEEDGQIKVLLKCIHCGLEAQGWYDPEIISPEPLFWEEKPDKKTKRKKVGVCSNGETKQ
jgi:hypothetical protein